MHHGDKNPNHCHIQRLVLSVHTVEHGKGHVLGAEDHGKENDSDSGLRTLEFCLGDQTYDMVQSDSIRDICSSSEHHVFRWTLSKD